MKNPFVQYANTVAGSALLAGCLLTGLVANSALGATDTWTGLGPDSKWQSGLNWLGGTAPLAGDSLVFTNSIRVSNTNNFSAGTLFNSITFAGPGGFTLWGNSITLTNGVTNRQVITPQRINLPITLGANNTVDVSTNGFLTLSSNIFGPSFGLTKVNGGSLTLGASNAFGGLLTIAGGEVSVGSDAALGTAPGSSATRIALTGNDAALRATATFTMNSNRTIAVGPAVGADSGKITVNSGLTLTYRGNMTNNGGTGGLTKNGPGTLLLSGTNRYTGPTSNRIGFLTLDFTHTNAPATNIISSSSRLSLGGETVGVGGPQNGNNNPAQLSMNGRASVNNTQTFNGTFIDVGTSAILVTNGAGGSANLLMGALSHTPGGTVTFFTPTTTGGAGRIHTTSLNVNGILGGWATIASNGTPAVTGIVPSFGWACVDANGNIVPYTNFFVYPGGGNLAGQVTGQSNLLFTSATGSPIKVDVDHATPALGTTNDVNTIMLGGTAPLVLDIGGYNVLRLGSLGGIFVTNIGAVGNNTWEFGSGVLSAGTTGSTAVQNQGTLTAGGAPNTPGELVFTINSSSQTANNSIYVEWGIADNGPLGKVSVVKTGPGPMKFRGHNSFSGNMYIVEGRIQMAGAELGTNITMGAGAANTANPDAFGTGSIFVFPGGQAFPSGSAGNTNAGLNAITNNWFLAGNGVSDNVGAIRLSGLYSNGIITLIGDARLGGGGPGAAITGNPVQIYDKITGPFNLDFGATGNSGGTAPFNNGARLYNQANDWSGNTTVVGRTGAVGGTALKNAASDVIPDGFGKGSMQFGNTGNTTSMTAWDLAGFSDTINGLVSVGTVANLQMVTNSVPANNSVLTLGNNDQSGTFIGAIGGNLSLVKIGGGTETLSGTNYYVGSTTISNGILAITGTGSISNTAVTAYSGGTLDISGATGFTTTNSVTLNGGNLAGNTADAGIHTLSMANASLTLTLDGAKTNVFVATNMITGGLTNRVNIIGVQNFSGYPATFTILKYNTANPITGAGNNFGLGAVPSVTTQGYVTNEVATGRLLLILTNGPRALIWAGNAGVNPTFWDQGTTTNWLAFGITPAAFFNEDSVLFDDTAVSTTVNLISNTFNLAPGLLVVSNQTKNFTFTGQGALSGNIGFTKLGASTLTLANVGINDFGEGISISNGTVILATDNQIQGGARLAAGATMTVGTNGGSGNPPAGAIVNDGSIVINRGADLNLSGNISGAGTLAKNDSAVLTIGGANSYTGITAIASGTVVANNGTAFGTADGGTTISPGAMLDVNGFNIRTETVTVSGSGIGGQGAIINSGAEQQNALTNVILAGNTTFGGIGRWDMRASPNIDVATATLSETSGSGYTLTKVGANQVALVGVDVATTLGNINVQQGILGIERGTTGVGDSSATLAVSSGATLRLFNALNPLTKNFTFNGDGLANTLECASGTGNTLNGPSTLSGNCVFNGVAGTVMTIAGAVSGTASINKTGAGTFIFNNSAPMSYSGQTTVSEGTVYIYNSKSGGTGVNVLAGAALGGMGTISEPVTVTNGAVFPGPNLTVVGDTLTINGNVVLNNSSNSFDLSSETTSGNDRIAITGNLTLAGTNVLNIHPYQFMTVGSNYTLITYSGTLNALASYVNQLPIIAPKGYELHVVDPATTPNSIQVSVDVAVGNDFWKGGNGVNPPNGIWADGIHTNWIKNSQNSVFTNGSLNVGDFANFDDSYLTNTVIVSGTVTPSDTFFRQSTDFLLLGSGTIGGSGGLYYNAGGSIVLANATNNYAGPTTIGTGPFATVGDPTFVGHMRVGNGGTNGTFGLGDVTNFANLSFNRSDSYTINNRVSGHQIGTITNLGPGMITFAGGGSYTGLVDVASGTTVRYTAAMGTNNPSTFFYPYGIIVENGGTLDIANAVNLGLKTVAISGSGVTNGGALVNNSGSATFVGANLSDLTLTGDSVIGGNGRMDIRGTPVTAENTNAALRTLGNPYKLTKIGTNQVQIGGVLFDPGQGDVEVQAGLLGYQTLQNMGDPNRTNTVFGNATFSFFDLTNCGSFKNLSMLDGAILGSTSGTNTFGGPIYLNGSNVVNVTAAYLRLTNTITGGTNLTKIGAATLLLSSVPAGNSYDIQAGTLDVTNTGAALTLASGQRIRGSATLSGGLTAGAGSVVAPGEPAAIGTLTVSNGTVSLAGSTLMKLNRGAAASNDVLRCVAGIALGGNLAVSSINTNAIFKSGDTFTLFSSSALSGSITPLSQPALWPGLTWDNSALNSAGRITVAGTIIPPVINSVSSSPTTFGVNGSGGLAGAVYYVLASTNVVAPLTSWTRIATNNFDGSGNFSYTDISGLGPQRFYTIQVP